MRVASCRLGGRSARLALLQAASNWSRQAPRSQRLAEVEQRVAARFPLLAACERGDVQQVKALLAGPSAPTAHLGTTPLIAAVRRNHLAVVEALLEAGADSSVAGAGQLTPLMHAAKTGSVEVARLLLRHGAAKTLEAADFEGQQAADAAAKRGHWQVAELLADAGTGELNAFRSLEAKQHLHAEVQDAGAGVDAADAGSPARSTEAEPASPPAFDLPFLGAPGATLGPGGFDLDLLVQEAQGGGFGVKALDTA